MAGFGDFHSTQIHMPNAVSEPTASTFGPGSGLGIRASRLNARIVVTDGNTPSNSVTSAHSLRPALHISLSNLAQRALLTAAFDGTAFSGGRVSAGGSGGAPPATWPGGTNTLELAPNPADGYWLRFDSGAPNRIINEISINGFGIVVTQEGSPQNISRHLIGTTRYRAFWTDTTRTAAIVRVYDIHPNTHLRIRASLGAT